MRSFRQSLRDERRVIVTEWTMNRATLLELTALMPAVRREWTELLHGEPALTPLGRTDTRIFLIDATLAQLVSGFTIKPQAKWLRVCVPIIGPLHAYCACGADPLTKYFATGERALRTVLAPALAAEMEEVVLLFRSLARREIEALCATCRNGGKPGCCERQNGSPF